MHYVLRPVEKEAQRFMSINMLSRFRLYHAQKDRFRICLAGNDIVEVVKQSGERSTCNGPLNSKLDPTKRLPVIDFSLNHLALHRVGRVEGEALALDLLSGEVVALDVDGAGSGEGSGGFLCCDDAAEVEGVEVEGFGGCAGGGEGGLAVEEHGVGCEEGYVGWGLGEDAGADAGGAEGS